MHQFERQFPPGAAFFAPAGITQSNTAPSLFGWRLFILGIDIDLLPKFDSEDTAGLVDGLDEAGIVDTGIGHSMAPVIIDSYQIRSSR